MVDFYSRFFRTLEDCGLDIEQLIYVYVLQYLFLPKINAVAWNNHGLSTENNVSNDAHKKSSNVLSKDEAEASLFKCTLKREI